MTVDIEPQASIKHLVAVGNNVVYAERTVSGTLSQVTGLAVDTSDNLNMFSGLQKAFIVNGTNLKIVDFANTKLSLSEAITRYPLRGQTLTQKNSDATMIIDFIDSTNNVIYGFTTSDDPFTETAADTVDAPGLQPVDTIYSGTVAEAITAPHGYDWTTYPDAYNTDTEDTRSYGSLPAKAYLGCWYRGRAVLSGNPTDPHQWYMSRQFNPFDYAYVANDAQSPVAGANADAGKIGDIVRALTPFHDDFLIFGCASSMHYLQGDPASGGEMHSIDDYTGIFGAMAWCFDKIGDLYFFGTDGVNRVKRGTLTVENLTQLSIPTLMEELAADPTTHRVVLGYDKRRNGIVIAITFLDDGSNSNYFYSIQSGGFFPEKYPKECGAYSMLYYPSNTESNADLLLGCKDGYIRNFKDSAADDDIGGETDDTIESNVLMPIQNLNEDDDVQGRLISTTVVNAGGGASATFSNTDEITVDIHVAKDAETLVENIKDGATPLHTTDLSGTGRKNRIRKRAKGKWLGIVLKNTAAGETWALGKLSIKTKMAGRIR